MIRRALLKAVAIPGHQVPVRQPRDAAALWLGHRRHPGDGGRARPGRHAEGHRPGRRRHHQRRLHPPLLRPDGRRATTDAHRGGDHHPDPPPHPGDAAARGPDPGLPGAAAGAAVPAGAARGRDEAHARAGRLRPDACEALRGHRPARPCRDQLRLSGHGERPLPDVALARSRPSTIRRCTACRRCNCSAPGGRSGSTPCRPTPTVRSPRFRGPPVPAVRAAARLRAVRRRASYLDEVVTDDHGGRMFVCSDTDYCETRAQPAMSARSVPQAAASEAAHAAAHDTLLSAARRSRRLRFGADPRAGRCRLSIFGRARCWPSSANRAPARPRC